ncbi:MAG: PhoH family protein, partial [Clostridia bacterium]|nr:PhoH family protein [Clostridia bacterium]
MEQEVSTVTRSFVVEDAGSLMPLFGLNDENIELIKKELGISLFTRGGEITLTGEEDSVSAAITTLEKLTQIIKRGDSIDKTRILYAIDLAREGNAERIEEIMQGVIAITFKGRQVKCKTLGQKKYVDAIKHNTCTFGIGPAGTGKTYLAVAMAVVALKNKDAERIILTR